MCPAELCWRRRISMEELRKNVGLVFQTPAPFPFSIYKNLT